MLLDSCFLIDLMAGDGRAAAKLDEITAEAVPIAVSSLSVVEVGYGLRSDEKRTDFHEVLSGTDIVSFGGGDARRASRILRHTERNGERVGKLDAMIGATAVGRDEPVVTRNVEEFQRMDGVRVSPY